MCKRMFGNQGVIYIENSFYRDLPPAFLLVERMSSHLFLSDDEVEWNINIVLSIAHMEPRCIR